MNAGRAAVFLDRDGTLNEEVDYLAHADGLRLLPGAAEAVGALNSAGRVAVVVTNQSGVARGLLTEEQLGAIHARLEALLATGGAHLDLILHDPTHPDHGPPGLRVDSERRKPRPGMLLEASERLGLDLARSWVIGDSERDLEAGRRAGCAGGVLVATGKGAAEHERLVAAGAAPVHFAPDVLTAVRLVLDSSGSA